MSKYEFDAVTLSESSFLVNVVEDHAETGLPVDLLLTFTESPDGSYEVDTQHGGYSIWDDLDGRPEPTSTSDGGFHTVSCSLCKQPASVVDMHDDRCLECIADDLIHRAEDQRHRDEAKRREEAWRAHVEQGIPCPKQFWEEEHLSECFNQWLRTGEAFWTPVAGTIKGYDTTPNRPKLAA